MLLTLKIKLLPNEKQYSYLKDTMMCFNQACNAISQVAYNDKTFRKFDIQKSCYYPIRDTFGLSAQLTIRAISKVAEAYKVNRDTMCVFRDFGAVVYDERILSFKGLECVSITTVHGRINVPMQLCSYHDELLRKRNVRGQTDLVLIDNVFYLMFVAEFPEKTPIDTDGALGVDLGIINIASDSTGEFYSGAKTNNLRKRYAKLRSKLQSKGTKSAKRLLKKRNRKERRMATDTNHVISKRIVEKALRHNCVIALESLQNIRKGKTVNKQQRTVLNKWSFYQLREFIEYKAKLAEVPVVFVNPQYTSQTCHACGHIAKENRKSQSEFICVSCGYAANADYNAALNIAERGCRHTV